MTDFDLQNEQKLVKKEESVGNIFFFSPDAFKKCHLEAVKKR